LKDAEIELNREWNKKIEEIKQKRKVKTLNDIKKYFSSDYNYITKDGKAEDFADYITNAPAFF
jgi:uncharacterized protein YifE (UPF0438 family)